MKFFRVSDVDGQLHAVTESNHEPLCRQGVQMLFPEDLAGAFSSTHPSACPACVAGVEAIRGDPEESYVDEYTTEVAAPPGEVAPSEPDDSQPADA